MELSEDLFVLDTRDVLDKSVGEAVKKKTEVLEKGGYWKFFEKRVIKCEKPITCKNKLTSLRY